MRKAIPRVLISAGVILILVAVALFVFSRLDDSSVGRRSEDILSKVLEDEWEMSEVPKQNSFFSEFIRPSEALENPEDEQYYEGADGPIEFSVIGILEIPKLKKRLPVLDRSTYALLNISVCKYSGSVEDKPVRLVIAGHNLMCHFKEISNLELGDEIFFTTRDGARFRYEMVRYEECHMSEGNAVDAGKDWDITLLTCKKERTMRRLVRFAEIPG